MKQAASRPSPPFPSPASGSCSRISLRSQPCAAERARDQRIGGHVDDVVVQRAADQELHREVVDPLGIRSARASPASSPTGARSGRARSGPPPRSAGALAPATARAGARRANTGPSRRLPGQTTPAAAAGGPAPPRCPACRPSSTWRALSPVWAKSEDSEIRKCSASPTTRASPLSGQACPAVAASETSVWRRLAVYIIAV